MGTLPASVLALMGNFLLSFGMVLQKKNVSWIGASDRSTREYHSACLGWFAGFILMNIQPIFNYLALMGLDANVVSALIGANVAFTAILAATMLHEKLGRARFFYILLLFAAMALAGARGAAVGKRGAPEIFNTGMFYLFFAVPLAAAAIVLLIRMKRTGRGLAVIIAGIAGCIGGYTVLSMRAVQLVAGSNIWAWFLTPYLYTYLVSGIASFLIIQVAYKDGEMQAVAPAYYGMQVIWPAVAAYFVLGSTFDLLQALAFVCVAFSIVMISKSS